MDTVQVYVVVGPTKLFMGGRDVPGGFEYLSRNLNLLAQLNKNVHFEVRVAHSVYHGDLSNFYECANMKIEVSKFDDENFTGLSNLDPIVQHGALLNKLFSENPPTSRFVLILDPDCYAIGTDLISIVIQEMKDRNLSVAGVSYPAWYPKEYTWKTPQLYFCLFDREVIRPEHLDLRAGDHNLNSSQEIGARREGLTLRILRRVRGTLLGRRLIKFGNLVELVLRVKIDFLLRRFEINPKDTGWKLGELIEESNLQYTVLPNILKREIKIPGFKYLDFLASNEDLLHIEGNLGWYFLTQGLTEGRKIGAQGIFPRALQKIIGSNVRDRSKWPPTSLLGALQISNKNVFDRVQQAIPAADFYAFGNDFCIFHIGSKGKGQISDEIKILDDLIDMFISNSV